MRGQGMFPITQEAARAGVAREGLGGRDRPVRSSVGSDQELASPGIRELVPAQLPPDVAGVVGPEVGVSRLRRAVAAVGSLDDDALGLDGELRELLLGVQGGGVVVAWVNLHLNVGVELRVDLCGGVEATTWQD